MEWIHSLIGTLFCVLVSPFGSRNKRRPKRWNMGRDPHRMEDPLGDGEAIHSQILDQYCILEKVSMLAVLEGG